EGADLAVAVAHDDDRRACGVELLREVAADAGELLDPAEVQPGLLEDGLALELVPLGRGGVGVGRRTRAQLGVVLGPGALSRLGEVRHRTSPRPVAARTVARISKMENTVSVRENQPRR